MAAVFDEEVSLGLSVEGVIVFKTLGSSGRKYQNKEHKNQVQSLN
jgi:hypothetical protein